MRTFFMIHMGFQGLESLYFHTPIDHSAGPRAGPQGPVKHLSSFFFENNPDFFFLFFLRYYMERGAKAFRAQKAVNTLYFH